jgi:hypothetical protein
MDMAKILTRLFATIIMMLAMAAVPAYAQATRTWVSGVGDDANPCSRTAPCKTFAGAISKTAAGGEINALDSGGFGGVTITKSITIKAEGVVAGVLVSGTNGITINAAATDRVILDGLDIEGLGGTSVNGVNILSARDVIIRNTSIRGFTGVTGGNGIVINSATKVTLMVEDVLIFNSNVGIAVISPGLNGSARIYNSQILNSVAAGVRVSGAGNRAQLSNVVIDRSAKSLEILSGGTINSFGDNILSAPTDTPTILNKG